jgi:hypothetical protein
MRPSAEATGKTIIGKKTCSEPMTTAASEYRSATGFFASPMLSSRQFRMPLGPLPRINCQPYVRTTTLTISGAMTIIVIACRRTGGLRTMTRATG